MSDYLADDRPIDRATFTRRAVDPRASVIVEACAGSGLGDRGDVGPLGIDRDDLGAGCCLRVNHRPQRIEEVPRRLEPIARLRSQRLADRLVDRRIDIDLARWARARTVNLQVALHDTGRSAESGLPREHVER